LLVISTESYYDAWIHESMDLKKKSEDLLCVPLALTFRNSVFCPHSAFTCLRGSQNKQLLFLYTAIMDWFL